MSFISSYQLLPENLILLCRRCHPCYLIKLSKLVFCMRFLIFKKYCLSFFCTFKSCREIWRWTIAHFTFTSVTASVSLISFFTMLSWNSGFAYRTAIITELELPIPNSIVFTYDVTFCTVAFLSW